MWLRENGFKEFPRLEPAEGRGEIVRDLINEIDVGKLPETIGHDARADSLLVRSLQPPCRLVLAQKVSELISICCPFECS